MPTNTQPWKDGKSDLLGVVLAGGESRRFGIEKSLFSLAGRPMAQWVLDGLKPWTSAQVAIAPEPGVAKTLGIRSRPDRILGMGPLGGLHSALSWAQEEGWERIFLLACDLPLVPHDLIGRILDGWPSGAPAVIPGSPGPLGFEPLCAGSEVSILPVLEDLFREGRRSMESALSRFEAHRIPAAELGGKEELALAFTNVNDVEVARWAELVLEGSDRPGVGER